MEQILHYIWKHRLFQKELETTEGIPIDILDVGLHNTDEGPDFFNAKIRVGDKTWVGNVEIHTSSSDWNRHGHQKNKTYNSVILHIVEFADANVFNEASLRIPQCKIKYSQSVKENISFLLESDVALPCCNYLKEIEPVHLQGWINTLLLERLERKSNDIQRLLDRFGNSWADVFYVLLSRSMGFGLNSDAFERLALSLPLNYILKQGGSLIQTEALLFGQAGLLENLSLNDDYTKKLKQEYDFLKNKYSLEPLDKHIFKALRIRPTSSPCVRIAQLASLLQNIQGLCSKVIQSKDLGQVRLLFHVNASEYWQTHYSLGASSEKKNKYIGDSSLDVMIINAVVPLLFAYGRSIGEEEYEDKAFSFLECIKAESNSITKLFANYGLISTNAYDSQALIQLKREYCEKRKCLYCRIGYRVLVENK